MDYDDPFRDSYDSFDDDIPSLPEAPLPPDAPWSDGETDQGLHDPDMSDVAPLHAAPTSQQRRETLRRVPLPPGASGSAPRPSMVRPPPLPPVRFASVTLQKSQSSCWTCGELFASGAAVCNACGQSSVLSSLSDDFSSSEDEATLLSPEAGQRRSPSEALKKSPVVRTKIATGDHQSSLPPPTQAPLPPVTGRGNPDGFFSDSANSPQSPPIGIKSPRKTVKTVKGKGSSRQLPVFGSPNDQEDGTGSFAGWLYKQKAQGRVNLVDGGWKSRFCVWDPGKSRLYYYHYEGEGTHANFVSFDKETQVLPVADDTCVPDPALQGCSFVVTASSYTRRPYVFCCGSREARAEWLTRLHEALAGAARLEQEVRQSVDEVWSSYSSARGRAKLGDTAVLDVRVKEASFEHGSEYFVACYGDNDQKFRTWIAKTSSAPTWDCDGTFSGRQTQIRIKVFSRIAVTSAHKLVSKMVIDVSQYPDGKIVQEWFSMRSAGRRPQEIRVRLSLQHTTSYNFEGLNGPRGVPTKVLPLRLDTGDLILFHNSHFASQATKMFTMSQWDHIGIVLRWSNNELKLFEATGNGVGLYKLSARLDFLHRNTKMAVRRLEHVERTPAMLEQLDAFICQMRGRHYKKRLGVLVKAAVTNEKESGVEDQDLSSVFCSELVVASYQKMGLVSDRFAAKAFLPKDLADKDSFFELNDGATLERKRIFSKKKHREKIGTLQ